MRRSGIVLAACPLAKKAGVTNAERIGDAIGKCPNIIVVKPRMEEYIRVSLKISDIYRTFTDLVEPYSIEQFIDVSGSLKLFGSAEKIAKAIQQQVMEATGVRVRAGISENKTLAKMACDNFAKKNSEGIFSLPKKDIAEKLWDWPVNKMFMVGSRMMNHFMIMGIHTIGDLAQKEILRAIGVSMWLNLPMTKAGLSLVILWGGVLVEKGFTTQNKFHFIISQYSKRKCPLLNFTRGLMQ